MESTTVDVNGGNAEVARDTPNLENEEKPTSVSENVIADNTTIAGVKMEDGTEVNGDVKLTRKIKGTPVFIKKLRKFKENSMTVVEADAKNNKKGQKRKLSEPDISSDDSMEFNGFDAQADSNELNGSMVLQKLIAEVEATETTQVKRRRTSMSKDSKSFDYKDDDMLLDEFHDDGVESPVSRMIKTEKESDTDSIGFPMGLENDPSKTDESSVQSVNSSANSSPSGARPKLKVGRNLKSARPHSANKQKIVVDLGNPLFREPFKYGWKRELVFRAGTDQHTAKARSADIYYYTPKGKKVRSFREVAQFLKTKELTIDNFTFFKEPLGLNDPDHEIIRDARVRESLAAAAAPTPPKKVVPVKKAPAKKIIEKPQTPPTKPPQKSPKAAPVPFKIKLPAKKAPMKKEIKSPPKEPEMLPPQWSSPASTRRSQAVVEKTSPPAKPKRVLKAKLQEPCSIRCLSSMGLIPSLQCSLCLCLYHPECVGEPEVTDGEDYICKNCHEDSGESSQSGAPPPPPLIPISMLGVQKAIKPRIVVPPKLQKIKKVEVAERKEAEGVERKKRKTKVAKTSSLSPGNERNDTNWLQTGNDEFLRGHDGTMPKPAQNIALMAGKRYIVVPKNNAMAVQPAITVRPDKIGDKAPSMQETSHREFLAGNGNTKASLSNDREKSSETTNTETNEIASTTAKVDETKSIEQKVSSSPDESFENFVDLSMTVKSDSEKKIDEKREKDEAERKEDVEKLVNDLTDETPMSDIVVAEQEVAVKKSEVPVDKPESTAVDKIEDAVEKMELSDEKSEPAEEKSAVAEDSLEDAVEKLESAVEKTEADVEKTEIVEKMEISKSPSLQTEIIPTNNVSVETKNATITSVTLQPAFKKKLAPLETDSRHFMVSVCAGYHALSRIFQYLKVQELLRAARVCKMWRDLAAHPNLWKTVRMKNSQVTDWDGFADSLKRHGTQHLDLRKMLVAGESDGIWKKFVAVVPRVTSLVKLELCRCPVMVVEEVIKSCPQLQVLSAMSIKCDSLNLESAGNLKSCQELRLKAISGMSLHGDLTPLQELTQLTQLSLTSVKELGKKNIAVLSSLVNLETLELGECSDFPDKFGTSVLLNLVKLERLRLEKGQGSCCTFDILEGVSKLETLSQLELVNFDVKNGFDKCLSNCKNIKRLLIIPTYISQSATSNNMVLGGVTELSDNLTHFVWGVTLELLRVTELFVDQCNQMSKTVTGDSIPVLKPVPCLKLIEDVEEDDTSKGDEKPQPNLTNPQVDILPLPQLQKLLLTALPKTRVKILKIPFHATWRQNISDTTTQ